MPEACTFIRNGKKVTMPMLADAFASSVAGSSSDGAPGLSSDDVSRMASCCWRVGAAVSTESPGSAEAQGPLRGKIVRDHDNNLCIIEETINVRFDAGKTSEKECDALLAEKGLEVKRKFKFAPLLYQVRTRDHSLATDAIATHGLAENKTVVYAEPVIHMPARSRAAAAPIPFRPNDHGYVFQWQWPKIDAETAWNFDGRTTGQGMRIAVIDRGFHLRFRDIAENASAMSGRFEQGRDFIKGLEGMPLYSHGTVCAAQAGAKALNNQPGEPLHGCGIAPDAQLMLLCVGANGMVTQTDLARAIAYAADPSTEGEAGEGADALSCAEGPPESVAWPIEGVLKDALEFAAAKGRKGKGMPVFWAVANANAQFSGPGIADDDEVASNPNVIAVGSSTEHDKVAGVSAFGPSLAFVAPGDRIYNVGAEGEDFYVDSGTSFAAPVGAGVAALMLSKNGTLTAKDVAKILKETCVKIEIEGGYDGNGHNIHAGHGRIDAAAAVRRAKTYA